MSKLSEHKRSILLTALIIVVFLTVLASCTFTLDKSDANVPVQESGKGLYITRLNNGLTITVKEVPNLPLVTIQFWTKVGSRNENDQNRGIAHIFEHIWFKGTPTQPVGSFDKRVAASGGYANAMTGQDFTAFYVMIPSENFEEVLALMADLFRNQLFDEKEIAKEKEVILEEQNIVLNDPMMLTDHKFAQLLFKKHPYRHPILGYKDTIKGNMPDAIREFYKTWYVPNNMNLIVVGDVSKERVVKAAQKLLGDIKPKELPETNIPEEPEQKQMRYKVETKKGIENTYAAIGFRICNFRSPDWYAMRVLVQILDGSENSRIQRELVQEKHVVSSSQTFFVPLLDYGAIETLIVVQPKKENEAAQAVLDEFNRFKEEYVSDEELDSAKKQLQAGYALQQEEIAMQGVDIGRWWTAGNFEKQPQYIEDIFKVTKEDIMKAAKKYLTQPTIFMLKPEE